MTHPAPPSRHRTPRWVWAALGLFVLLVVFLVGGTVRRPRVSVFPPSALEPRDPPTGLAGPDTVTLDARAGDRWVLFDLARRRLALPGEPWDLAVRRHRLAVNGGEGFAGQAAALRIDLGFDEIVTAPPAGYEPSRVTVGGDTVNSAMESWYRYGFFSHLLTPEPATFVLRTHDGRFAKLAILGYYCPGPEAGCLTLEYVYQGDGGRRFTP